MGTPRHPHALSQKFSHEWKLKEFSENTGGWRHVSLRLATMGSGSDLWLPTESTSTFQPRSPSQGPWPANDWWQETQAALRTRQELGEEQVNNIIYFSIFREGIHFTED